MMKLDLQEIGASGIDIERTIPAGVLPGEGGGGQDSRLRLLSDGRLHLAVGRAGGRFHLRGCLEADVEAECGRCLVPFSIAVRPKFDYYLVPRRHVEEWAELEIDETTKREVEVDSLELDLVYLAEEQVRLALPMKLLCSEDCCGICFSCGIDLNREACVCSGEETEGAGLAGLAGLLERMKNDASDK